MSVLAQPTARTLIVGAGVRDETPEMARVIEASQMHELVDQHVVANRVRHQDESPVEADVTRWRAGSPSRALVAYADARYVEAVMLRQAQQLRGQLLGGLAPQLPDGVRAIGGRLRSPFKNLSTLLLDPRAVLLGK